MADDVDWLNAATCIENAQIAYDDSLEDSDGTPVDTVINSGDLGVILALAKHAADQHRIRQAYFVAGEPPKDGRTYAAVLHLPMRWKAYKPSSQQFRAGIKGRWQRMNEFGGWDNGDHAGRHWPWEGHFKAEANG